MKLYNYKLKSRFINNNLFVFILLLFVNTAYSAIYSPIYTINQQVEVGCKEFDFRFDLRSKSIVNILRIEKTCGCTTVDLDKWNYKSDDVGVLSGKINLTDKHGEQTYKIMLLTDSKRSPVLTFTIHLSIPKLVNLKPGLLFWKINTKNVPQKACIQLFNSATFVYAKNLSEQFLCDTLQDNKNTSNYIITVTPKSTSKFMHDKIVLKILTKDNIEKFYNLHLLIR